MTRRPAYGVYARSRVCLNGIAVKVALVHHRYHILVTVTVVGIIVSGCRGAGNKRAIAVYVILQYLFVGHGVEHVVDRKQIGRNNVSFGILLRFRVMVYGKIAGSLWQTHHKILPLSVFERVSIACFQEVGDVIACC